MGATNSGPEVGFCVDELFGKDIDLLSWDFGLTDGRATEWMEMYFLRAGMNPNRPVTVAMADNDRKRATALKNMELHGLAAFNLNQKILPDMLKWVPDTADGLDQSQIDALPKYVRYLRCGTLTEKGEPGCGHDKYSHDVPEFDKRQYFASWHPGW